MKGSDPIRALVLLTLLVTACGGDRPPDRVTETDRPAARIITLAPHLTELVFSAGAGNRIVGAVEYSDFPAAAIDLPRIGDAFRLDYEVIIELDPDLILAWESGTPQEVIERLDQLGFRVVALGTGSLGKVADNLRVIGQLTGTERQVETLATEYERSLGEIQSASTDLERITVYYQVSARPMLTISRLHVIGEAIELCGGENIFGDLPELTPSISPESVIDAAPEVIVAGRFSPDDASAADSLNFWRQWVSIPAIQEENIYLVDANQIARSSLRVLNGVRELCEKISMARAKR